MNPEKMELAKNITDVAAITAVVGTWLTTWMPIIAAILSSFWLILRIFDWIEARLKKVKIDDQ